MSETNAICVEVETLSAWVAYTDHLVTVAYFPLLHMI